MPKKLLPRKKNILIFSDGTGQAGGISVGGVIQSGCP
jgi:hypothetical protein